MEHTTCPVDEYNSRIVIEDGVKFATISPKSFSPFMVKKTYSLIDLSKKYEVSNTKAN